MGKVTSVEEYLATKQEWSSALLVLREIVLTQNLQEQIKWNSPVYTNNGKNIVGLSAFKAYVGLWFFQGALLSDKHQVLINAQENKTVAMRQWRFKGYEEIEKKSALIKQYIHEAIDNQMSGLEIKPNRNKPIVIPPMLHQALENNPRIKELFDGFSKTRKREFSEHISEAKKEETKKRRIRKIIALIEDGRGLHDQYRS